MKGRGEKRDGVRWLALYGKPGGTLLRVVYGPSLEKAKLGYIFFYRDDKDLDERPEREKGESLLGYYMDVRAIPKGKHQFWFYQYFGSPYGPGDEKKFNAIVDHPLEVKARAVSPPGLPPRAKREASQRQGADHPIRPLLSGFGGV